MLIIAIIPTPIPLAVCAFFMYVSLDYIVHRADLS